MAGKTRRAFTYVDLIVLVLVLALLAAMAPAQFGASSERANRIKCVSNLRQIGQAMMLYAQGDQRSYPRCQYDPRQPCNVSADPKLTSANSQAAAGQDPFTVRPNDVTAAIFLLVRCCDMSTDLFVCPTSNQEKDALHNDSPQNRINFTDPAKNLGYSIANPYPQGIGGGGIERGYKWSPNVSADWAIAADRNDGIADPKLTSNDPELSQRMTNSNNHEGDGQNVLYNDGHVEWYTTPWAGAAKDNIYTRAKVMIVPGGERMQCVPAQSDPEGFPEPADDLDTVLVPVFDAPAGAMGGGAASTSAGSIWPIVLLAVLILGAVGGVLWWHYHMRKGAALAPALVDVPMAAGPVVPDISAMWYVAVSGTTTGPYTWEQLRELVGRGNLGADGFVCAESQRQWIPAGQVQGLNGGAELGETWGCYVLRGRRMMRWRSWRRGLTMVEVLVCIGMLALAISIILPILTKMKSQSSLLRCPSNLRQIGQALMLYAEVNGKVYPRVRHDPTQPCPISPDPRFTSSDPSAASGKDPFAGNRVNDVTAVLFLLVRETELSPEVFICDTGGQAKDKMDGQDPKSRINFTDPNLNLSYSITNPYPGKSATERGYKWSPNVSADWAIAADRNDAGGIEMATTRGNSAQVNSLNRRQNSRNHEQDGQNVLYNDGHVEWYSNPWAGSGKDNIYTRAAAVQSVLGGEWTQDTPNARSDEKGFPEPAAALDTVLLPVFDPPTGKPPMKDEDWDAVWMWTALGVGAGAIVAALVVWGVRRRRAKIVTQGRADANTGEGDATA